ncbi:MAG: hypothetical protein ABSH17_13140 [Syntrophobacteraceae bacterium]|jgi:hypothetical protein
MWRPTVVLLLIVLAGAGCTHLMPPQKIPTDRQDYLEAVSKSWKEQLLRNVVTLRYGEALTSLEMTSITTGYELDSNLTAGSTAYLHKTPAAPAYDLTSVGGSLTYTVRPTITYVPMRGDALQKTMIEPISPLRILKGLQCGWEADFIFPCSVRCINDLRSPWDRDFFLFADTLQYLKNRGVIRIVVEEPVEPKVTKVPDEFTITLNDKTQGTVKNPPVQGSSGKDVAKPKPGKNCEEEADKKKKDKEDSPIGYLVVDHFRAKSEDARCGDLKGCVSESVEHCNCVSNEDRADCISTRLKYLGYDVPHANDEASKSRTSGNSLYDYVKESLKNDPKAVRLSSDLEYCVDERETLERKVCRLKHFLWPDYYDEKTGGKEQIWQESYKHTCKECHFTPDNTPKFQTCDWPKIIGTVSCAKNWKHPIDNIKQNELDKIENINSGELKGIISWLKHSSEEYEVYKVIDADQKLPLDPYCYTIVMQTQSILQTLTMLSRLIEVPEDHKTKKKTEPYKANYREMSDRLKLKISYNKQYPENPFVAIKYRDFWFFIDDDDYHSKQAFTSIEGILSMSETGTKEGTPVLTLPVQ